MNKTIEQEEYYLLALHFIKGLGPIKANSLLAHFGSSKQIFAADKKELSSLPTPIHRKIAEQIMAKSSFEMVEKEMDFCHKNDIQIVSILDSDYPARLKALEDKPIILFKKRNIFPAQKRVLSIVGTRKSTEYGHRFLEQLFDELNGIKDLCVVSGLALGIDQKAHQLSIKNHIPTLAVMGLGLDKIYPAQNTNLANHILKENGGWMTETSSQDKISQGVFPRRNRLIAGLCDALLVVETDVKGGSVITAQLANEYDRDIFALPGRVSDAQSRGCNELIKNNLAVLVNTPQDLIESMNWYGNSNKHIPKTIEIDFVGSAMEKKIIDLIRQQPKIEFEKLIVQSNIEHSQLVETLLNLELEGIIHALPGNKYEIL